MDDKEFDLRNIPEGGSKFINIPGVYDVEINSFILSDDVDKYKGKPYYRYARQGRWIPRSLSRVRIYRFEIGAFKSPEVEFTVECSQGTYIRSLVHDLGHDCECGAIVTALHRAQDKQGERNAMG